MTGLKDTKERLRRELDVLIMDVCIKHVPANWRAQFTYSRNAIDATITSGKFTVIDWIGTLERSDDNKEKQK